LPDIIPDLAGAVSDDVDAAAAAWSARRMAAGTARTSPDPREEVGPGGHLVLTDDFLAQLPSNP